MAEISEAAIKELVMVSTIGIRKRIAKVAATTVASAILAVCSLFLRRASILSRSLGST